MNNPQIRLLKLSLMILCDYSIIHTSDVRYVSKYRYIEISKFSFNIMIQYWLLGVSIHWCGQFSKPGLSNLSNFIPKSNYNKLVCITLIDFFYHFLTNTTKQDIYIDYISISIIISNITILYRIVIFLAAIRNTII